jgi:glutamate 5-kinase
MMNKREDLAKAKRIVIKAGTSVVTNADGMCKTVTGDYSSNKKTNKHKLALRGLVF